MKLIPLLVFCSVAFRFSCGQSTTQGTDLTLRPYASGADVVRAVLSKIDASGAFGGSLTSLVNVFMRRMAYVESRDGRITPYPAGGIWNVSHTTFHNTQITRYQNTISSVYNSITSYFGLNWTTDIRFENLTKPLYSGLAVRLQLHYLEFNSNYYNLLITPGKSKQAEYWINNIRGLRTATTTLRTQWNNAVEEIEATEGCRIQADVVFVLDTSGSIMAENFEKMINYTYDFTNELIRDTDNDSRVGVILFSNNATVKVNLESTLNKSKLLEAIRNISFLNGPSTNTVDGLERLIEQPWRSELVLRLGIIIVDGQCIHYSGQMDVCHEDTLRKAAEQARNQSILIYALGVGDYAVTAELQLIAFGPEYVGHIDTFSDEGLEEHREATSYEICFTTAQPIAAVTVPSTGSLSAGQTTRFYLYTQEEGVTIRICIMAGRVVLYVSTSVPNPNEAFNNWAASVTAIEQSVNCIAEYFSLDGNQRRRRQTNNEAPLYIAIKGIETSNEFTFNSSFGDVTSIWDKCTTQLQEPPPCPEHAECYNTEESFLCRCSPGFRESTDGIKCAEDGCDVEFDDFNYMWSEATIGDVVYGPCPCSEFLPEGLNDADMAVRTCLGSIRGGGMWGTADYSQCVTIVDELSQGLCNDLMNLMMLPVEVSESIVQRTSQPQNLSAIDVASAIEAVVRLTEQAIVNSQVRDNYLRIIDNIQMADPETVAKSQSSSRLLGSLGQFLDEVQIPQNATSNQTTLTYLTYAIQIQDVDPDTFNGQTLNVDLGSVKEALNIEGEIDDDALMTSETAMNVLMNATGTIQTPESLLSYCSQSTMSSDNAGPQRLSYSVFLTDVLFQTINESLRIGSLILAARFNCGANATLMPPITVTLQTNTEIEKNASNSTCAMWDSNDRFGVWSTDGCREIVHGDNKRVCECTQLAHFGILFDLNPQPLPSDAALALSVVTYIGSVLSLICLTLFIITYLAVKKLRSSIHGKILVNMSLALMGLYISFLFGGSRHVTPVAILCGFIAAFLNYFMLVFFAWTSTEAIWLYLKLVKIIGISQYESKFIPVSMPTVWFIPLLIVVVSAGAGHPYYTGPFYCRATEWPFWFALVLPFLLMYIFDWIMFILIMGSICKSRNILHTQPAAKEHSISPTILKQNLLIAVVLSTTFGLGWGFGLLATSHSVVAISIVFQALFSIFVGAQGVLIFCFHGIHNKDVRALWKTCFDTLLKQPRKVYNIAHSVSKERNQTASPSTNSHGFSSDTMNKTDVPSEYENNPTFTTVTSTMQGVDTKVNVAYGYFASTATTDSEGVYEIPRPGSEMTTNQAYGQTSSVTAAIENDGYYEDIAGGSNAVYETIPT